MTSISNFKSITTVRPSFNIEHSSNTISLTNTALNNIECQYSHYTYFNIKDFREKFNVNNNMVEKIWDCNFKKNKVYCPNCNIYPMVRPINKPPFKGKPTPNALIIKLHSNPKKPEDFTFICYKCYNEHLYGDDYMHLTAPMDIAEDGECKHIEEYVEKFIKYGKKNNSRDARNTLT